MKKPTKKELLTFLKMLVLGLRSNPDRTAEAAIIEEAFKERFGIALEEC